MLSKVFTTLVIGYKKVILQETFLGVDHGKNSKWKNIYKNYQLNNEVNYLYLSII